MYGQNREQLRQVYCAVWRRQQDGEPLAPMEQVIAAVILQHPEYHTLLSDPDSALERDYTPEMGQTNPFLHMGMHIALHEQVQTDRPPGIAEIYRQACAGTTDRHEIEHEMMECLGQALWDAQRQGGPPDESAYLECLRQRIGGH